jgi:hypothetical protein
MAIFNIVLIVVLVITLVGLAWYVISELF